MLESRGVSSSGAVAIKLQRIDKGSLRGVAHFPLKQEEIASQKSSDVCCYKSVADFEVC
jgi:hypothetical protein